jgi:signal transduction histidine kinase
MGFFAHELRNLLGTATLAYSAVKAGNLSLSGSTGTILGRSLQALDKLISISIEDVRLLGKTSLILDSFSLADFITEVHAAATLSLGRTECIFRATHVDPTLAINGTRDLLMAALANLLQNAFKFTQPRTEVLLTAYAAGDRIIIDVQDHCGGLGIGVAESMFLPFSQAGENRTGIGLGLTIAKQSVTANGGTLTVEDLPTVGCVFKISLPRHAMPT